MAETCEPGRVSVEVPLGELAEVVARRGSLAYLVTVGEPGPRVVSVSVHVGTDGSLRADVGRHTRSNVADRPAVTLLWPADPTHPQHTLLVDGSATVAGDAVTIRPSRAMLHRVRAGRGAPEKDGPTSPDPGGPTST